MSLFEQEDFSEIRQRIQGLASRFSTTEKVGSLFPELRLEEHEIPIRAFRVFEEKEGEFAEIYSVEAPQFPIARLYLSSAISRGTLEAKITDEFVREAATFFGPIWFLAMNGRHPLLMGLHIGTSIRVAWR